MSGARIAVVSIALLVAFGAPAALARHRSFTGEALYYADRYDGQTMACGGTYRTWKMVAAHRTLPCGTKLRVKNLSNGRVVRVTVTDRGPFETTAKLDLSRRAAKRLGYVRAGRTTVRARVVHD